jgi:hypothetical protein
VPRAPHWQLKEPFPPPLDVTSLQLSPPGQVTVTDYQTVPRRGGGSAGIGWGRVTAAQNADNVFHGPCGRQRGQSKGKTERPMLNLTIFNRASQLDSIPISDLEVECFHSIIDSHAISSAALAIRLTGPVPAPAPALRPRDPPSSAPLKAVDPLAGVPPLMPMEDRCGPSRWSTGRAQAKLLPLWADGAGRGHRSRAVETVAGRSESMQRSCHISEPPGALGAGGSRAGRTWTIQTGKAPRVPHGGDAGEG